MSSFTVPTVADVEVSRSAPKDADAVAIGVGERGPVPKTIGLTRAALEHNNFEGKVGQALMVPSTNVIAVGIGDGELTPKQFRNAAAAAVRATGNRVGHLAINLADGNSKPEVAQAVTEGALLAAYRYVGSKTDTSSATKLTRLTLIAGGSSAKVAEAGAEAGRVTSRAQALARELANTPANLLNAIDMADIAVTLAGQYGLDVEVFNKDQLTVMGCGGMLGVNKGSVQPPRVVKLSYSPRSAKASVALVGKGIMYDSGGISLKPSGPGHVQMKMDMSGAAAVLAAMTTLGELGCRNKVTGWLMCTDNMPSGSAVKLSDVLTIRNGTTVEVQNTDAEGRLVLADGLSLANEESPDVIADIATLTGAVMVALGTEIAGLMGSDEHAIGVVRAAAEATDEPVWQLPLAADRYRKLLDSDVADMRNIGGPNGGTILAAVFLSTFAAETPWVHIDMAGTMSVDADNGWKSRGATGYGARLLSDFATTYTKSDASKSDAGTPAASKPAASKRASKTSASKTSK